MKENNNYIEINDENQINIENINQNNTGKRKWQAGRLAAGGKSSDSNNNALTSQISETLEMSIKGIFLLILTVASNYNAETLGCRMQKILTENMMVKHLLNLVLIYFAINLTSTSEVNPNTVLYRTIFVWFGFLLFIRLPVYATLLVFILLLVSYAMGNYIDFYKERDEELHQRLKIYRDNIFNVIPFIIVIGVMYYAHSKYQEYGDDFNVMTFIFGNTTCKSMTGESQ